ncbi:hypothetical protein TeGR_g7457, partial [Tetraparma gracilis]
NIVCVALSLFFQLWITWFVNRKRSWRRIAREVLYLVLFIKPGIDAARVAGGGENDDGLAAMDPLQELALSKAIEMVFESIPAAIIQTRALITSKERTTLALVSIIISCCTTGFAAATMCMHNAYFLFNQLTAHASVFVSVHVYVSSSSAHLSARALWMSAGSLFAAWALTYVILACMVKPEYRYLFYTTETTVQFTRSLFEAETDEVRMDIFTVHEVKWAHYKDEVREFTHANWAQWKDEKPAWFTEEVINRVPDEYIPVAALAELNAAAHGGQRRRSSLGLVESVRRGSISAD